MKSLINLKIVGDEHSFYYNDFLKVRPGIHCLVVCVPAEQSTK